LEVAGSARSAETVSAACGVVAAALRRDVHYRTAGFRLSQAATSREGNLLGGADVDDVTGR